LGWGVGHGVGWGGSGERVPQGRRAGAAGGGRRPCARAAAASSHTARAEAARGCLLAVGGPQRRRRRLLAAAALTCSSSHTSSCPRRTASSPGVGGGVLQGCRLAAGCGVPWRRWMQTGGAAGRGPRSEAAAAAQSLQSPLPPPRAPKARRAPRRSMSGSCRGSPSSPPRTGTGPRPACGVTGRRAAAGLSGAGNTHMASPTPASGAWSTQRAMPAPHLTSAMQLLGQLMIGLTVMVLHMEAEVPPHTWGRGVWQWEEQPSLEQGRTEVAALPASMGAACNRCKCSQRCSVSKGGAPRTCGMDFRSAVYAAAMSGVCCCCAPGCALVPTGPAQSVRWLAGMGGGRGGGVARQHFRGRLQAQRSCSPLTLLGHLPRPAAAAATAAPSLTIP
jgi:hypothetical protein